MPESKQNQNQIMLATKYIYQNMPESKQNQTVLVPNKHACMCQNGIKQCWLHYLDSVLILAYVVMLTGLLGYM